MPKMIRYILFIIITVFITSCGNFIHKGKLSAGKLFGVYKIEIPQGNIITQEQISQLKKGVTKKQVVYTLGYPVLDNIFDKDKWIYVSYMQHPYSDPQQSMLIVKFKDDKLVEYYTEGK